MYADSDCWPQWHLKMPAKGRLCVGSIMMYILCHSIRIEKWKSIV